MWVNLGLNMQKKKNLKKFTLMLKLPVIRKDIKAFCDACEKFSAKIIVHISLYPYNMFLYGLFYKASQFVSYIQWAVCYAEISD